ncbi:MAG TPA: hypothetical protein VF588_00800 [Pyrinomonadaceae bacterium]|jgi:hypothetical protein
MLTTTLRLSLVLAFAALLALAGMTRPRAANAQATTTTTHVLFPFTPALPVPCANGGAGELVQFSGEVLVVNHFTFNDNHTTIVSRVQPQGISGVGLTTGDTYHINGGSRLTTTFQSDGTGSTLALLNITRLVGPGPDNNLLLLQHIQMTFNNDGELTSSQASFSSDCK